MEALGSSLWNEGKEDFLSFILGISYILLHVIVTRKKKGMPQASDYRMNSFRPIRTVYIYRYVNPMYVKALF